MKHMRHLCAAVVLTLALTSSASAGWVSTGIADPPPPSADGQVSTGAAEGQMTTTIAGQIEIGVAGQMDTTLAGQMPTLNNVTSPVDPLTQMALGWLHSLLSLF